MAALTRSGARKASEIVMLILRVVQPSRQTQPGDDDPFSSLGMVCRDRLAPSSHSDTR